MPGFNFITSDNKSSSHWSSYWYKSNKFHPLFNMVFKSVSAQATGCLFLFRPCAFNSTFCDAIRLSSERVITISPTPLDLKKAIFYEREIEANVSNENSKKHLHTPQWLISWTVTTSGTKLKLSDLGYMVVLALGTSEWLGHNRRVWSTGGVGWHI